MLYSGLAKAKSQDKLYNNLLHTCQFQFSQCSNDPLYETHGEQAKLWLWVLNALKARPSFLQDHHAVSFTLSHAVVP